MAIEEVSAMLWHNRDSGETQIWALAGHMRTERHTVVDEQGQPALIGPPFRIAGFINGFDILWYNSDTGESQIWGMDRHQRRERHTVLDEQGNPALVRLPFRIVAVGRISLTDFTPAIDSAIYWHNDDISETQIWGMDGYTRKERHTVVDEQGNPALVGPPFGIVGIGAFDEAAPDTSDDILWYNSDTGESQIWLMSGHKRKERHTILDEQGQPALVGPPFSIVGSHGRSIYWYNSDTCETQIWSVDRRRHQREDRHTVVDEQGQPALVGPPFLIVAVGETLIGERDPNEPSLIH